MTAGDTPRDVDPAAEAADSGLVICAKTRRLPADSVDAIEVGPEFEQVKAHDAYQPRFPSSQMLGAAVAMFDALESWDGREGPRARIQIGPGVVGIKRIDPARAERRAERAVARALKRVDELAAQLDENGQLPPPPPPRRAIIGWSRKSRANMVRALGEIDYLPMFRQPGVVPAMVTLTYPGDWLTVAPHGFAVKAHLDELLHRYERAWGDHMLCVWKLEFQRRGAPHFHLLTVPPHGEAVGRSDAVGHGLAFKEWLSVVWADVVDHPDPVEYMNHLAAGTGVDYAEGARLSDPRRAAVYFTKHGAFRAKEYQHVVPEPWREPGCGPGRFWGYRKLTRRVWSAEIAPADATVLARTIRRWSRAQQTTREVDVWRTRGGAVRITDWRDREVVGLAGAQLLQSRRPRRRRVRRRVERMRGGAGWVSVNQGPSFAGQLARYLAQLRTQATATVRSMMADRVVYEQVAYG